LIFELIIIITNYFLSLKFVRIDAPIFHNQEGGELVLTNFAQF